MDEPKKGTRRRGELLEDAILLAAWQELAETGFNDLTMESVAARAGTNKAVLYRRWANKSVLVLAAIRKHMPRISHEVPNTGDLRGDVYAYLKMLSEPSKSISAQTFRGLITGQMGSTLIATMLQAAQRLSEDKLSETMMAILKNAELRGEICLEKLPPHIISLPLVLLRYEVITKQEALSDEAIARIVDDIFIPLVYGRAGTGRQENK